MDFIEQSFSFVWVLVALFLTYRVLFYLNVRVLEFYSTNPEKLKKALLVQSQNNLKNFHALKNSNLKADFLEKERDSNVFDGLKLLIKNKNSSYKSIFNYFFKVFIPEFLTECFEKKHLESKNYDLLFVFIIILLQSSKAFLIKVPTITFFYIDLIMGAFLFLSVLTMIVSITREAERKEAFNKYIKTMLVTSLIVFAQIIIIFFISIYSKDLISSWIIMVAFYLTPFSGIIQFATYLIQVFVESSKTDMNYIQDDMLDKRGKK